MTVHFGVHLYVTNQSIASAELQFAEFGIRSPTLAQR